MVKNRFNLPDGYRNYLILPIQPDPASFIKAELLRNTEACYGLKAERFITFENISAN